MTQTISDYSIHPASGFIEAHFTTMTQIEVLCFFRKHRRQAFSVKDIRSHLFLSQTLSRQTLDLLESRQLLVKESQLYRYNDSSPYEKDGTLEQLVTFYSHRKSQIVELLFNAFIRDS